MRSILIIEDEPRLRLLLEDVLGSGGFEVKTADCAQEAVAKIAEMATTLFALITDIELGDRTSGWELARYARSLNPDLCIVYISGRCGDRWASEGVPGSHFLQKPFGSRQLLRMLAAAANDGEEDVA